MPTTTITPTQKYVDIEEVKENVAILQDGTMIKVLLCSSINFALKSEDEQNALISGYMQFLNSLKHPLQIVIQSRKLNMDAYINNLKEIKKKQTNELLRMQIDGYLDFVKELIEIGEIMTKRFFIVVPYNPMLPGSKVKSFWSRLGDTFKSAKAITLKKENFKKYLEELDLLINNVMSNLTGMGLEIVELDTQSLIELFYNMYNPTTSQNEKLTDVSQLQVEHQ